MRNSNRFSASLLIFFAAAVCFTYGSCKKGSAVQSTAFVVQYSIVGAHNTITSISYVGPAGDTIAGNVSEQTDTLWSKIITVAKPPFTAGLAAAVNNTTSSGIDFFLQISVNGVVLNSVEKSIPSQASTDASVQAAIN